MKTNSDRPAPTPPQTAPVRIGFVRESSALREPVSDYFTVYLLQELLSSIGWRHKS
jgi:hypothetical protein